MSSLKLDFTEYEEAQDMIALLIKNGKGQTAAEVIDYAVNPENYERIVDTGWGPIALPIWGHDNPERKRETIDDPNVDVGITDEKLQLIKKIIDKEEVDAETAIAFFLLFTMESMGYHI